MCGILGFNTRTRFTDRLFPTLAAEMSSRGKDSWGQTNGRDIWKALGSITKTYCDIDMGGSLTWHTRNASIGGVSEANAHPFEARGPGGKVVVGVHNGCLNNHTQLNQKYGRTHEVDSMHIFSHLAEGKPLTDILGWGAVVWYESTPTSPLRQFFSLFNMDAFHVTKLTSGEVVWASTKDSIEKACVLAGASPKSWYDLQQGKKYEIADGTVFTIGDLEWGPRFAEVVRHTATGSAHRAGGQSTGSAFDVGRCMMRACYNRVSEKWHRLCEVCVGKVYRLYYGEDYTTPEPATQAQGGKPDMPLIVGATSMQDALAQMHPGQHAGQGEDWSGSGYDT